MYDLRLNELQTILEAVKQNKSGSKQSLRKRVLNLLSTSSSTKTRALRNKIISVYKARPQLPQQPSFRQTAPNSTQQNFLSRIFGPNHHSSYVPFPDSNSVLPYNEPPPQPSPSQFENLPFFKTMQTLLTPMYCQSNIDSANFSGLFFLTDSVRHSIVKSWDIARQEYKIQIILRLVQVGLQENVTERLPYNITVSVNDRQCKLSTLNIPTKAGITPWRCNVPIDITQQTDLRNCLQNTLKITWAEEPHQYIAGVFVAQKLTWNELLVELQKRPLRASEKTKDLIKKSMESDVDMGIDSMFATVKDPLSKTRMELPARGIDCIHLQCFDAKQFLQMNEQKQTWSCPLCKKKVKFENIEVDEFFLDILRCPNLSEDCENVILLQDGSWTEKKPAEFSNSSKPKESQSNNNHIEVFTLSDSDDDDDDDILPPKRTKYSPPKMNESIVKSENIETEDLTEVDSINSAENLVLDLSLKNSSSPTPSTNSDYQSIITLNDEPEILPSREPPSHVLNNFRFPNVTITQRNSQDLKPSCSNSSTNDNHQKNANTREVLCVITLD